MRGSTSREQRERTERRGEGGEWRGRERERKILIERDRERGVKKGKEARRGSK